MARNGSGTYSVPNIFVSGNTITASGHNQNWSDIAAEITNSVAADGQTSMTAPLKAANGTAALPSYAFASDPDTGMYRHGANELGFAVNGVVAGYFDTSGYNVSGNITMGPGGTGSISAVFVINGPSATGKGAAVTWQKNSTASFYLGHHSSIVGSGTSSDLLLYNASLSTLTFRVSIADDSITYAGKQITPASTTARAGLNVPSGTAPTSPTDGDIWQDGTNLKVRIGSQTSTITGLDPLLVPGFISGLNMATAGSSATFTVGTGVANDVASGGLMSLGSAISKTTSSWAVGGTNGGLDTGAIAINTWYHVYLIKRTDTGVVDVLFSLSASSPTMPASYTLKRRIGSLRTNGSSQWTTFTQTDDQFIWATGAIDISAIANTASRVSKTLTVPTGVVVEAMFRAQVNPGANMGIIFTSLQETDQDPLSSTCIDLAGSVASVIAAGNFRRLTNISAQIGVRSTGTSSTYSINTYGWIDTRGK